ncbi:MAG: hypothetical protein V3V53_15380, partial [Bacteroidales bacterium]
HNIDPGLYILDLTLKTDIPDRWKEITVTQNGLDLDYKIISKKQGRAVMYSALPGVDPVIIKSGM